MLDKNKRRVKFIRLKPDASPFAEPTDDYFHCSGAPSK